MRATSYRLNRVRYLHFSNSASSHPNWCFVNAVLDFRHLMLWPSSKTFFNRYYSRSTIGAYTLVYHNTRCIRIYYFISNFSYKIHYCFNTFLRVHVDIVRLTACTVLVCTTFRMPFFVLLIIILFMYDVSF